MSVTAPRFHPSCMSFTPDQVKKMEKFVCPDCTSQPGDKKVRQSSPRSSPTPDHVKVHNSTPDTFVTNLRHLVLVDQYLLSVDLHFSLPFLTRLIFVTTLYSTWSLQFMLIL